MKRRSNKVKPVKKEKSTIIDSNAFKDHVVKDSNVNLNISQEWIITTEDKVRLCLVNHLKKIEKNKEWLTPGGIFTTILLTILTADFKELIFPKETWQSVFIFGGIVTAFWTILSFFGRTKASTVDSVVAEIKEGSKTREMDNNVVFSDDSSVHIMKNSIKKIK